MNYIIHTTKTATSKFIPEDYFPAIVEFSDEELNNHFIEYNYKDSDMFELSVHPKTHFAILLKAQVVCTNYYSCFNEIISPSIVMSLSNPRASSSFA
ncbi:hypothetical protein SAMN02910371_01194 [Butyrivibrio sp. INlla14]|nr:hypothetical protein SAMN02910371_01194 [Butyrivibrio sp. INlla14]